MMTTNASLTQCVSENAFGGNVKPTVWTLIAYVWNSILFKPVFS